MLEVSDERVKGIILFLLSTGVRIRAIVGIKLQDLITIPEYDLYQVTVYSDTKERYVTFTTPEAAKAIKVYLNYRERYGEKLTAKSPVFRDQFDRTDPASVHNVRPLNLRTLERLISRTLEKSGIRTVERITELNDEKGKIRKNVRLTAGFRKFFDTQLIYAAVEPRTKEMFMGHSIGLDDHYFKPGENYILNEYLKAVDNLTISDENKLKLRVKELTAATEKSDHIIKNTLQEKDKQIQTLVERQEKFEQLLQSLIESGQLKPVT